ncbi:cation:proton antiporter [Thiohalophilus sp.]|uniref:cation:proton antiporter domain-containing protein n=1 Tax=Thiohalophilus sp. TaxID=3028392 RepID=UPI0039760783
MLTATIWLSFAFGAGLFMRLIGLPPLVGYLAAGFLLSANGHETNELIEAIAHAGVLLLLFSVGLKLRLKSLIRTEVLAGSLLHMGLTIVLLWAILSQFGTLSFEAAVMIAIALSFSSTVVAAKVLESKKELRAFHGRVAIGILIMQDLVAVAILSMAGGVAPSPWSFLLLGFFLLRPLLHWLLDICGHGELVILYGLLVALVVGGGSFEEFGLSSELGALLLGIILSDHKRASELSNALWGLKEILLVGFFLQIGLSGHPTLLTLEHALLLNLLLPLKALLFFFILLLFRLRARSAFLTGLSLSSFSEFGLIVASVAEAQGWISTDWLVLLAVTVAVSFAITAPLNRYSHDLYQLLGKGLKRFESRHRHPDDEPINVGSAHILIVGMGRVGTGVYDTLRESHLRAVGLDSDPGKVENHRRQGRRVLYADAEDPGLWTGLSLNGVRIIMLCMPELSAKLMAIQQLRERGFDGQINATALYSEEIEQLKNRGADLVYNYYDSIGVSFADKTLQTLPNELSPSVVRR